MRLLPYLLFSCLFITPIYAIDNDRALEIINRYYEPATRSQQLEARSDASENCHKEVFNVFGKDPINKITGERFVRVQVYTNKEWKLNQTDSYDLIILPPTGGVSRLDLRYAKYFCSKAKMRVAIIENWEGFDVLDIDPVTHTYGAVRSAGAVRHVLDFLRSENVAILGNSVGAISASIAMGADSRLTKGVLIAGGADMAEIIGRSNQDDLVEIREKRMKYYKLISVDEYVDFLRLHLIVDPKAFFQELKEKKIYHVISKRDSTVPTRNQKLLWRETRNSSTKVKHLILRHVPTIIYSNIFYRGSFLKFLTN